MQQKISFTLAPEEAADDAAIKQNIAHSAGKKLSSVFGFHILKKSIDARGKKILINLTVNAFIDEPLKTFSVPDFYFR